MKSDTVLEQVRLNILILRVSLTVRNLNVGLHSDVYEPFGSNLV